MPSQKQQFHADKWVVLLVASIPLIVVLAIAECILLLFRLMA
jgi:hypothetical protein